MVQLRKGGFQKAKSPIREKKSRHSREEFGPGKVEYIICPEGEEAYYRKAWHHTLADFKHTNVKKKMTFRLCPFHQMVKNRQYEGEIAIYGAPLGNERDELIRLMKNKGEQEYQQDPMHRIIRVETRGDVIYVETSENQLAQKIAKKVQSRFKNTIHTISRGGGESDVVRVRIDFSGTTV